MPAPVSRSPSTFLVVGLAWLVPGAGHLYLRRTGRGLTFLVALPLMFLLGLWFQGHLYGLEPSQLLSALSGASEMGIGLLYFVVRGLGYGAGEITAATFEAGNAFLIVAGLLNLLVVLDAYDIAIGSKP